MPSLSIGTGKTNQACMKGGVLLKRTPEHKCWGVFQLYLMMAVILFSFFFLVSDCKA